MLEIYVVSSLLCLFVPSFDYVFVVGLFVVGSFGCLFLCSFVRLFVVGLFVRSSNQLFVCLFVYYFARFCVCSWLWCWWGPLSPLGHTMDTLWPPLGIAWAPLASPWGTLWAPWHTPAAINRPAGDIGHCRGDIWVLRGTPVAPFGHTLESTSAILATCLQKAQKNHYSWTLL